MYYLYTSLFFIFLFLVFLSSCGEEYVNPDKDPDLIANQPDTTNQELPPASFSGLNADIFSKSYPLSGCYDGNFEADSRTVESSYNTLVNHPIIKNDTQGSFSVRVKPGDVENIKT